MPKSNVRAKKKVKQQQVLFNLQFFKSLSLQRLITAFNCRTRNAIYTVNNFIHLTFTKYPSVSTSLRDASPFRVI